MFGFFGEQFTGLGLFTWLVATLQRLYREAYNGAYTLARLAEKGIEPEKPPYTVREGGSRLCFVRDPDGYRIELIERGA